MVLKNQILKLIRGLLNPAGYDIVKYKTSDPSNIIFDHLRMNKIDAVLDIGANTGQYSLGLRKAGYKGRIVSFEPLAMAYTDLKAKAAHDKNWQAYNYAIGDIITTSSINVSGHSPSSSILAMTSLHIDALPGSEYINTEKIEIKTLDSVFDTLDLSATKVFLKVDTQGYEKKVLEGAEKSLARIKGIQLELSAFALYEGEDIYYSICRYIEERDFRLVRIIPGFVHKTTHDMLQFDAIFFRK
jgi:FkbM family methyltransferase